ncbi:hypothetical protein AB4Y85_09890 [Microvirga sp. 2YAF29]|uniref:hypothetical protein n=1 Tax=Microvirga sp. 2YAF29 TaxID=3233031 RepID=UPI003F9928BD
MMSAASDFEWKETYRARLDGLESVLAAMIDLLIAQDVDLGSDLARRLVSLEALMREQNAHLASLKAVRRFRDLVEDEAQLSDNSPLPFPSVTKFCSCDNSYNSIIC